MLRKLLALMGLAGLVFVAGCGETKEETPSGTGITTEKPKTDTKPAEGDKEVTTASGLKYVDVKVGTGEPPKVGQIVSVHYTGTFTDGTKFDSSYDHTSLTHPNGEPYTFPIGMGEVVKGWDEGIMTMKVGGKRKLIIPGDLAYGSQGRPGIPPDTTLLFDVELVKIK